MHQKGPNGNNYYLLSQYLFSLLQILHQLQQDCVLQHVVQLAGRSATLQELLLVHSEAHVACILDYLDDKLVEKQTFVRESLYHNEHTKQAALVAVGSVLNLVKQVCSGALANGFALVRPPGHHAGMLLLVSTIF